MKNAIVLSILALAAVAPCYAGPVLTLDPVSGSIQGLAGQTVGWGFTLTSDPADWISVVTTMLLGESDPSLGVYMDHAGALGGPANGVLAPGAPPWTVPLGPGVGVYSIDPGAAVGRLDQGTLDLNYETFSANPNVCTSCALGFANLQVPFQVEVAAAPEPATWWLAIPLLLIGRARRRR
jgi:hypothetical protein